MIILIYYHIMIIMIYYNNNINNHSFLGHFYICLQAVDKQDKQLYLYFVLLNV